MAEDNVRADSGNGPVVRNWRLLLVACVLGLVVVLIYNVHISRLKSVGKGEQITVYKYTRDMEPDEKITLKGLEAANIPKDYAKGLGRLIRKGQRDYAANSEVNRHVGKGDWVLWGHITATDIDKPSGQLGSGMVAVTIGIDPHTSLGRILRVGDRVNVLGMLSVKGQKVQAYRIIKALKVLAIGGQGPPDSPAHSRRGASQRGVRTYRSITVEMKPEVSLQWANVRSYVRGIVSVELCSKRDRLPDDAGMIDPALGGLTESAAPASLR